MALGFIKKVFTFGKDKPSEPGVPSETGIPSETGVDAGLSAEEKAAIAAESEPHDRVEQLPLAEDPVLAEEVDTAGGPSDDLTEDQADEDDVTADDLSLLPLSLLEAEEAADEHPSDATPSFDELLDEAEGAAPGTEIALPRGFSTVVEPQPEPETPEVKQSWFQRLKAGLFRTSSQLTGQISALFTKRKLDEETLEELEDLLIQADLGVETAMRVTATLSSERYGKDVTGEDVTRIMAAEIVKVLKPVAKPLALDLNHKPHVILVVGVNGTGKTTTIGKLAAKLSGSGLKVMLAAGDTFRAAAIEQLKIWADRTGSTFIGTKLGADAAGLAYDAFEKAKAEKSDVLIIDTAGRLQNKTELMDELEKIVRVLSKLDPDAPHTVLQTLDATTGQNAMNQVEIFRNVAGVNGLIMTKLDGTARGGILVAIAAKHKLPVYFIGVGEGVDDLEPFEAEDFARAIAGFGPSS
ncbi:signal recognition particle-docking protein FtsY [Agrobacterium vitis]|uniref:signal recognition particle-docking protein FtsY n=1 Tax=Rhizobium/Agrobacterium group TaxID=227290 RepID=UPI0008DC08C3|nr:MULTISPECIES: signal recognition particle-docking protein FtsY [Rhizobium/Agrobacterium group]MCF1436051.1 signal recognition particle-docking protein FtsY [Allorhizobium ampelinum]MUO89169.1 signal recognition particle-docking protein FtsY [Agrobacterium vitis]MUZ52640.1 signal recognition particle-docking protein FtsY [Agrobacterium vitis]MUZ92173.1 signal recognition particle-docking protein FtsY [Agrobacterium vitis]MVA41749.1 signal recognition particle-docking protein FtsY [Agrobacter